MQTKLIITCVTDGEEFEPTEVACKFPIAKNQWEMIKKALPLVLPQVEANISAMQAELDQPVQGSMSADFETIKGA